MQTGGHPGQEAGHGAKLGQPGPALQTLWAPRVTHALSSQAPLPVHSLRHQQALRQEVAKLYDSVAPEQLVLCVPEEGIYLTMRALLSPGDRVVCAFPAYQSLFELASATGCELVFWQPTLSSASAPPGPPSAARGATGSGTDNAAAAAAAADDDVGLEFDVSVAEALIQSNAPRLVVVNFPHNPTGAMLGASDWSRLVDACRGAGAWLLSDEMVRAHACKRDWLMSGGGGAGEEAGNMGIEGRGGCHEQSDGRACASLQGFPDRPGMFPATLPAHKLCLCVASSS